MTASILPFSRRSPWRRDGRLPRTGSEVAIADRTQAVESAQIVTAGPATREGAAGRGTWQQPAVTTIAAAGAVDREDTAGPATRRSPAAAHTDPITRVTTHNISLAVRTPRGELDSRDGHLWWQMGARWYVLSPIWPTPTPVMVPQVVAALNARQALP